jgi:phospholipase C
MGSIPHSRNSQVDAWNGGGHDGWIDAKRSGNHEYSSVPMTMGHYTREDLPFYYALADAFTVCDQNYCAVMTSTTPNRSTFWTGTIRDRQSTESKVYMRNEQYERLQMPWKTYPERLQEAGISWKFYQNELTYSGLTGDHDAWLGNFGCNVLEFFGAYNIEAYPGFPLALQAESAALNEEIAKLEDQVAKETDPEAVANLHPRIERAKTRIAELQAQIPGTGAERYHQLTDAQRKLHHAAFVTNGASPDFHELEQLPFTDDDEPQTMVVPKGDILFQFRKDVNEGKLPAVSWLTAPEKFSDHPTSPWYGAWYVSEAMDILTKNPEVWKKTIFILTYDENDGYFDHAPSYVAADPKRPETGGASAGIDSGIEYTYAEDELAQGVAQKEARSGPIGMGFRVPMIIASPWSRGGWVNSQLFDHTSTLMFLEHFIEKKFGKTVKEENISSWRRAVAGDLTSVFRPYEGQEPQLDYLNRDKFVIGIEQARYKEIPSNYKRLDAAQIKDISQNARHSSFTSHQEPGTKPACALPYELYAEGRLTPDGTDFELQLKSEDAVLGSRAAGAPFNVYLRNLKDSLLGGLQAATYAVKAGDTVRLRFPLSLFRDSNYSIEVLAPNGFYRSFSGTPVSRHVQVQTEYEKKGSGLTGNIVLHLHNANQDKVTVTIADNSYETGTIHRTIEANHAVAVVLHLKENHGWHDFTVKVDGSDAESRFAGRVETGRPTFSDPFMAKSV